MGHDYKYFKRLRTRLFVVVFGTDTPAGKLFDIVLLWAIVLSIVQVMLESVPSINARFGNIFEVAEWAFTILFTVEYTLRLFIERKPSRYALSFYGIIDFLALLPTYLTLFLAGGSYLVVIRAIRLLRVFRILKLSRYMGEANVITSALAASRYKIMVFLGAVFTLAIITGTLMYLIEGGENGFTSIPRSIYWAIVTITTVGYGDIAPQTVIGQFLASFIMLMGYAIIAVPTGIVTAEMTAATMVEKTSKQTVQICPNIACDMITTDMDANYCKRCGEKFRKDGEVHRHD